MKLIAVITMVLGLFNLAIGQEEKVNLRDDKGEKHGKWIIYLDECWAHTDSSKAVYYRYTFYEHGSDVYMMGPIKSKKGKMENASGNLPQKGKIVLIDGEYKSYNENGKLSIVFLVKDGWFVKYTKYRSDGTLEQIFDYTKLYEGQEHSWCMSEYRKDGSLKFEYYVRRNADGTWPRGKPN